MYEYFCLNACMCTARTAGAYGGQKWELHALELELWMVYVWVLKTEPRSSVGATNAPN